MKSSAARKDAGLSESYFVEAEVNFIPAHTATTSSQLPQEGQKAARSAHAVRVLVADDSAMVRECLSKVLTEEGYEVVLAVNGEEALEKYAPGLIDMVLLDLEMPVKSGWEAFEELVARKEDQAIILMADRLDSVDLTTTGHSTRVAEKPLNLSTLLATMKMALGENASTHHTTIVKQQNLARFAKPYVPAWSNINSYDHWGIND